MEETCNGGSRVMLMSVENRDRKWYIRLVKLMLVFKSLFDGLSRVGN
jgi:hypothetical protein